MSNTRGNSCIHLQCKIFISILRKKTTTFLMKWAIQPEVGRNMIICNYVIWNCEFYTLLTKTKILKYKNQRQNITVYIWIFFGININIHSWSFVYLVLSICILHSMYGYCFDTKIYIYQIHVLSFILQSISVRFFVYLVLSICGQAFSLIGHHLLICHLSSHQSHQCFFYFKINHKPWNFISLISLS